MECPMIEMHTTRMLGAVAHANHRAPRPTAVEVHNGRIRARWVVGDHHVTVRLAQVDDRWVAMPSGKLEKSNLILLTHAATWAGVALAFLEA